MKLNRYHFLGSSQHFLKSNHLPLLQIRHPDPMQPMSILEEYSPSLPCLFKSIAKFVLPELIFWYQNYFLALRGTKLTQIFCCHSPIFFLQSFFIFCFKCSKPTLFSPHICCSHRTDFLSISNSPLLSLF